MSFLCVLNVHVWLLVELLLHPSDVEVWLSFSGSAPSAVKFVVGLAVTAERLPPPSPLPHSVSNLSFLSASLPEECGGTGCAAAP